MIRVWDRFRELDFLICCTHTHARVHTSSFLFGSNRYRSLNRCKLARKILDATIFMGLFQKLNSLLYISRGQKLKCFQPLKARLINFSLQLKTNLESWKSSLLRLKNYVILLRTRFQSRYLRHFHCYFFFFFCRKNCLKSDVARIIFVCSFLAMITVKFNDSARWKVYIHFTIPSERWRNWVKGDWPPPPNMTSHSGGTDCLSVSITDEDSLGRRFGWQPIRNFPRWHNCHI